MNRNEQRKLNTLRNTVLELIGDYKAINNPAFSHFKQIMEGLNKIDDPAEIEVVSGNQYSLSAIHDKLKSIIVEHGNPSFDLGVTISDTEVKLTAHIKHLFKNEERGYSLDTEYIYGSCDKLNEFYLHCETWLKNHFEIFKSRSGSVPELVIEQKEEVSA